MRDQTTTLAAHRKRVLSVRMESSTVDRLAELAAARGLTISTALRIAVRRWILMNSEQELAQLGRAVLGAEGATTDAAQEALNTYASSVGLRGKWRPEL